MRMSNLAAALLRPQISMLPDRGARWNHIYATLACELGRAAKLSIPLRNAKEEFVASSIQFTLDLSPSQIARFLRECDVRGLYIKWFGTPTPVAFTSNYEHWHYLSDKPAMAHSMGVLRQLLDLRTPLSLTDDDCLLIGKIVAAAIAIASASP
jgi:dTDP-4-amino-4,6-dideoxygalactose transaminase